MEPTALLHLVDGVDDSSIALRLNQLRLSSAPVHVKSFHYCAIQIKTASLHLKKPKTNRNCKMNRSEAAELGAFNLSVNLTRRQMSKYLVEGGLVQEEKKPAYCLDLARLRNNS